MTKVTYRCKDTECSHEFEIVQGSQYPKECPKCGYKEIKLIRTTNTITINKGK